MKLLSMKLLLFVLSLSFITENFYSQGSCDADHTVILINYEFSPSELTIAPGETVAFINVEGTHDVNGITNSITGEPFNNPEDFYLNEPQHDEDTLIYAEVFYLNFNIIDMIKRNYNVRNMGISRRGLSEGLK